MAMRPIVSVMIAAFTLLSSSIAHSQSFSCPYGKQPSCLDYSDNVCDGYAAKCVKKDAQCFDSYTCYPGGFVCKDKLDSAISEYDSLVSKHNILVDEANRYRRCILNASTLDDAQSCRF